MYAVVTMSDHMCGIPLWAMLREINHVHVSQAAPQTPVIPEEKILAALAAGEQLLAEEEEAAVKAAAKKAKKARQKVKRQQAQHSQPVIQGSGAGSSATQYSAAQSSAVLDVAQQPAVPHSSASDESASLFLDAQESATLQIDAQDTEAPRSQTQGSQAQDSAAQDSTAGNTNSLYQMFCCPLTKVSIDYSVRLQCCAFKSLVWQLHIYIFAATPMFVPVLTSQVLKNGYG